MNDPEPRGSYILEGVLLTTLVLGPGVAIAVGMDLESGSIAEWVAASGTVAAFIAAVLGGKTAMKLWTIESDREQDRLTENKRSQAALVAAWYGPKTWTPRPPAAIGQPAPPPPEDFGVWVRNASQVPVTRVDVRVLGRDGNSLFVQDIDTLPPSDEPVFVPAPRGVWDFLRAQHWWCSAEILFRDAADQDWTRERSGRLREGTHGSHTLRVH